MEQAGVESPNLEGGEKQQAADHAPLRGLVIHEIIREQGEHELRRSAPSLVWSALAAGLSMGLSFLALGWFRAALPDEPWRHLITSIGYTAGFVAVVLGRQALFTESTLTAVLPVLSQKSGRAFAALLRFWLLVLIANIVGTWLFAAGLTLPGAAEPSVREALLGAAGELMSYSFGEAMVRGVIAGWLIALMVWLLPSSRSSKVWVIFFMSYLVGLGKLTHIVAGSSEAAYAVLLGQASMGAYWGSFFIPTLIGNIIGGVSLVALLNHAPVREDVHSDDAKPIDHGPLAESDPRLLR